MKERDDKLEGAVSGLRGEMVSGFMKVTERVSKVEGIIEGLVPSVRNQPSEAPREGVA